MPSSFIYVKCSGTQSCPFVTFPPPPPLLVSIHLVPPLLTPAHSRARPPPGRWNKGAHCTAGAQRSPRPGFSFHLWSGLLNGNGRGVHGSPPLISARLALLVSLAVSNHLSFWRGRTLGKSQRPPIRSSPASGCLNPHAAVVSTLESLSSTAEHSILQRFTTPKLGEEIYLEMNKSKVAFSHYIDRSFKCWIRPMMQRNSVYNSDVPCGQGSCNEMTWLIVPDFSGL